MKQRGLTYAKKYEMRKSMSCEEFLCSLQRRNKKTLNFINEFLENCNGEMQKGKIKKRTYKGNYWWPEYDYGWTTEVLRVDRMAGSRG